jgi:hypothetical protein
MPLLGICVSWSRRECPDPTVNVYPTFPQLHAFYKPVSAPESIA